MKVKEARLHGDVRSSMIQERSVVDVEGAKGCNSTGSNESILLVKL